MEDDYNLNNLYNIRGSHVKNKESIESDLIDIRIDNN